MKKTKLTRSLLAACSIVALSVVLSGCLHSSDDSPADTTMDMEPEPTAYDAGLAAIQAAATAEAAQAAYDAVDQTAVSGDEALKLQAALASRLGTLATAALEAEQKMALMAAAGMIDTSDLSTQNAVDAARAAIVVLRGALAAAADVSDADKAMYMSMLDDAVDAVDAAQGGIDTATRRTNQMTALSGASDTLQAALAALAGQSPTQAQIDAASAALAALNSAIEGAADLTDDEKTTYQREADNAAAPISTAQSSLDDADDAAQRVADMAMAATAAKMYAGIGPQADVGNNILNAEYNTAGTAIEVTIGTDTAVPLSEDKDTTVAALDGWAGKRYADPAGGDSYEAMVYSNVEAPTQGRKFGAEDVTVTDATRAYEYDLTDGALVFVLAGGSANVISENIAFTGVTRTAGKETFKLPDPNPGGADIINIPGSYHGVSGTYNCTPTDPAVGCSALVAAKGFTLAGGTWTFVPSDANARVMESADTAYASYGWWIKKAENDGPFTASAFHDFKGDETVDIAELLGGTATYMGGAGGYYALSSSTGGTNDAGAFTARATLEADFEHDKITGTIDSFMGADGEARDWSVKLNETDIGTDGAITPLLTTTTAAATVWTIGENAAAGSGQWSGNLREEGTDGVPQVATGTFYSEYGTAGRMVGAFGATKEE